MNCTELQTALGRGPLDVAALRHMRSCGPCLELAVAADPENLFRSLGGDELVPAGGVEAFASEVMQQVHLRQTERAIHPAKRLVSSPYRWSVAAALAAALVTGVLQFAPATSHSPAPTVSVAVAAPRPTLVRPVVEEYEATGATIIELPTEPASDVQVVMIFDESLPVDL